MAGLDGELDVSDQKPTESTQTGSAAEPPRTRTEAFAQAAALDAPLNERLAAYTRTTAPLGPAIHTAYERLIARLEALRQAQVGPRVGEPMPDFILPDQHGRLVTLESVRRDGPVVLNFDRGHWCPYCRLTLRALAAANDDVQRRGGRIVSIVPERAQFSKKLTADAGAPFAVLSDIDLSYALSLGLVYWIGAEIKALYDKAGIDFPNYHGNGNYFLPVAAAFVIGADGIVADRYVDPDFRTRMETDRILAALDRLRA
jgi:peroxiredoxin